MLEPVQKWLESQSLSSVPALLERQERSYLHPYGFVVSRLSIAELQPWSIRLHRWPTPYDCYLALERTRVEGQLIHAHGWDLWSLVLGGDLEERKYSCRDDPAGEYHLYTTPGNKPGTVSSLTGTGKSVALSGREYRVRRAGGGAYRIPAGQYHSTLPARQSISLVATLQESGQQSSVLARKSDSRDLVNESPPAKFDPILDEEAPRWASGFVLFTAQKRIYLVRTIARANQWQPVGGERDEVDASPMATVIREVQEEIGITLDPTQLRWLGSRPADLGDGQVCFWQAEITREFVVTPARAEIAEGKWWDVGIAKKLAMFRGSSWAVENLYR